MLCLWQIGNFKLEDQQRLGRVSNANKDQNEILVNNSTKSENYLSPLDLLNTAIEKSPEIANLSFFTLNPVFKIKMNIPDNEIDVHYHIH